jgi:hypothetical protein
VTVETHEETKKILQAWYGDKNRIIQAHLDYLEDLQPTQSDSPEALNSTYVEYHHRIQSLKTQGKNIEVYGRILAPNIVRVFPADICRRWHFQAKRVGIPENNITKLKEYLNEEADGALSAQKIRGESSPAPAYVPTAAAFQVSTRLRKPEGPIKRTPETFGAFYEARGHWAQDCQQITDTKERTEVKQQVLPLP